MSTATRRTRLPRRTTHPETRVRGSHAAEFAIVIDTREQIPYSFPCPTVRAALPSGDYSIPGYEHLVAVERKRPEELFTCFGAERARFRREYERLQKYRRAVVVIEGTFEECAIFPFARSEVRPAVVINSLMSWHIRFGVAHVFAGTRTNAEAYTYRYLEHFFRVSLEENASYQCLETSL